VKEAGGVEVVIDPVGGDRAVDSLRCLNETGRLVIVGFTAGSIPEIKVNRLLLNNLAVVGAGWGAFALSKPAINGEIQREIARLIVSGHVRPVIGVGLPLARGGSAPDHRRAACTREDRSRALSG
jgi:NADPH:quinone reductase